MSPLQGRDVSVILEAFGPRGLPGHRSESHQGMCIDNKNHLQGLSNQNADPAELHNMIAKVFSDISIRLSPFSPSPCCPETF